MQAQLECELCGKTPDQTEFSTKMLHRFPPSRAKAVQFEFYIFEGAGTSMQYRNQAT